MQMLPKWQKGPTVGLLQVGAWMDVTGLRQWSVSREAREIAEAYPGEVPRPPHWSGFRIRPEQFEFWQGRPSRLHDRLRYTRANDAWRIERLAP